MNGTPSLRQVWSRPRTTTHRRTFSVFLLASALFLGALVATPRLYAQDSTNYAPVDEAFALSTGDIFEILGTNDDANAQFAWVLEHEGTFLQASRSTVFRVRLSEPGRYRLSATANATDGAPLGERFILLDVQAREDAQSSSTNTQAEPLNKMFLETDPLLANGTISLPDNRQILKLAPAGLTGRIYRLDLDTSVDSNNDANTTDDDDAAGTFFRLGRVPLFVWLSSERPVRELRLSAIEGDAEAESQTIKVARSGAEQLSPPPQESAVSVSTMPDGSLSFSLPHLQNTSLPFLFRWSFGDGGESMLNTPTHRYLRSGTYTVHVSVRNLQTGEVVYETDRSLSVSALPADTSSVSSVAVSSSAASSSSAGGTQPFLPPGTIALVIKIILVILGSITLGAAGVWVIGKILRRDGGGLQRHLEDMESRLVGKKETNVVDIPPPMEIKRTQGKLSPAEKTKTEEAAPALPPSEPVIQTDNAPAWLRKGLKQAASPSPAGETPLPTPPTESSPTPASEPSTQPPATPTQEPAVDLDTAPPWLQRGMQSAASTEQPSTLTPLEPTPPPAVTPPVPDLQPPAPPSSPEETKPTDFTAFETEQPPVLPPSFLSPNEQEAIRQPTPEEASPFAISSPPPVTEPQVIPPQPEPLIPAPTPEPLSPPPQPASTTAPDQPSSTLPPPRATPPAELSPQEKERAERERERKRRKRQRYRENLKKRKNDETLSVASNERSERITAPTPFPTPPVEPNPAPTEQPPPPPMQPTPVQTEQQAQQPSPPPPPPQPQPATEKNESPAPQAGDSDVVFVVEAEGIQKEPPK